MRELEQERERTHIVLGRGSVTPPFNGYEQVHARMTARDPKAAVLAMASPDEMQAFLHLRPHLGRLQEGLDAARAIGKAAGTWRLHAHVPPDLESDDEIPTDIFPPQKPLTR